MPSMQDALHSAFPDKPSNTKGRTEVVTVVAEESGFAVRAVHPGEVKGRLKVPNTLFLELRRKIREITGQESWAVRYASQVDGPLMPFLHSSELRLVLIDALAPYRNPLDELDEGGCINLIRLNSHARYFKTLEQLEQLNVPVAGVSIHTRGQR